MFERLDACPLCRHPKYTNYEICTDHLVSGESFALVQCEACGMVYTNPRPTKENLGKYYDSPQYHSHSNAFSPAQILYSLARRIALQRKYLLIKSLHPNSNGKLLDFGCGAGHFLRHMQKHNWQVDGVEISEHARLSAQTLVHKTIHSSLDTLQETFDLITAWHVVEHMPDPVTTLHELREHLNPSGHLVIAVPNHLSADAKHYRSHWAGYDVPRHLMHFSQKTMKLVAKKCKLKLVAIHPMYLDAYYVSLLSEQHLGTRLPWFRAITQGRASNKSAKQTGEYSSLIYILAK